MPTEKTENTEKTPPFELFIAIDWSGAKGGHHRNIAVAMAERGDGAPRIIRPPTAKGWARGEVAAFLEGLATPFLAGFDFSFAPPFVGHGAYFPGLATADNGPDLWRFVDRHAADEDYGPLGFMEGFARPYFWMGARDGPKAPFLVHRQCEQCFNAKGGGKASTVYDCVGAAQVAKASFAGMRVLHRLHQKFAIWPFDPPARQTIVEIYTRAMLRHAGGRGTKIRSLGALNEALAALGARPIAAGSAHDAAHKPEPASDHETDALVAAAALRKLTPEACWWRPAGLTAAIAHTEGWTFGVR